MTTTQEAITPTVRRTLRRGIFWISMVCVGLLITLVLALLTRGATAGGPPLSPANAGPTGAMALAEVLRAQGITVTHATTLTEARDRLEANPAASLFVTDELRVLDGRQLDDLRALTDHVVVMNPAYAQLTGFADEIAPAGQVDDVLTADCDVPAVATAAVITGDGYGYRLVDDLEGARVCLDSGQGVVSLIQFERDGTTVTVLGTVRAFSNDSIGTGGNAALALWLLGTSDELVWYESNIVDAAIPGAPTIGELTPDWVSAAIVLLGLTILALALWRGRRFGPLVIENLPVTVRASETMEGRARLYQKSTARLHSLDTLRVGTITRLAALGGLGRAATTDDVIHKTAATTGYDPQHVRSVLVDAVPHSDTDLIRLSDSLLELERAVEHATTTPRTQGE